MPATVPTSSTDIRETILDVIGDTPHDIACGRAIGAQTVGVATGIYTSTQLAECQPDFQFEDFSDLQAVLAIF